MFTAQQQTTEQMTTSRSSSAQSDNSDGALLGMMLILHLCGLSASTQFWNYKPNASPWRQWKTARNGLCTAMQRLSSPWDDTSRNRLLSTDLQCRRSWEDGSISALFPSETSCFLDTSLQSVKKIQKYASKVVENSRRHRQETQLNSSQLHSFQCALQMRQSWFKSVTLY